VGFLILCTPEVINRNPYFTASISRAIIMCDFPTPKG
jgi:hypothetical protein